MSKNKNVGEKNLFLKYSFFNGIVKWIRLCLSSDTSFYLQDFDIFNGCKTQFRIEGLSEKGRVRQNYALAALSHLETRCTLNNTNQIKVCLAYSRWFQFSIAFRYQIFPDDFSNYGIPFLFYFTSAYISFACTSSILAG